MKMKRFFMIAGIIIGLAILVFFYMSRPLKKESLKSEHFVFLYEDSDSAGIGELVKALEDNYQRISNDLKTTPANPIRVFIYSNRLRYGRATGNWFASGNVKGIAELHFLQTGWDESDSKKIAVHEFTHAVVLKLLVDQEPPSVSPEAFDRKFATFPTWLWEATSVYEAGQFYDPKSLPFLQNNSFPNLEELNNRSKGGKIYKVGYTIIEYIIERYGREKLIELISSYGNLEKVLGITGDQFLKDWYNFIKQKYLSK